MKIISTILLLFLFASCGVKEEDDSLNNDAFFNIVYETLAVREIGKADWVLIDGTRDVTFPTNNKIGKDEEIPNDIEGTFTVVLLDYTRSQAIGTCSGGYSGTYLMNLILGETYSTNTNDTNSSYTILNPYNPDGNGTIDPEDVVDDIRTYEFKNTVLKENLVPAENCSRPFTNHTLKVVRFSNGTLIMIESSKGLEYFMRPKLRIER